MSESVRPHRQQPTRLHHPWDSPGKNTGVGCHFLLQSMKGKSESEVPQSYPTLSDPMDCSLPGSSMHGIFQARVLEWGAIAFSSSFLGWNKSSSGRGHLMKDTSGDSMDHMEWPILWGQLDQLGLQKDQVCLQKLHLLQNSDNSPHPLP